MSGSSFRGRGIEPWSAPNGYAAPFRGVYSSNPRFYHPRLSYGRLPTPENWSGRSNYNAPFLSWKNGKYQPSACRNKFNFRSNGRGRGTIHRGASHFPSSNTPSTKSHSLECNQNVDKPEKMLVQDQYGQDKFEQSNNSYKKQTPLLGSKEEHQQKITETAVRLKEKLSNITKEDISNLWQDDLSTIPSSNIESKSIFNVSIPTLSYKEPDLNLTFNDFKDIGRIDSDHSMSDKYNGTNITENASNFVQDTLKKKRNKAIIEVINLIEIEEDVHDVESMTDVNNTTNNKPHNNNGQKLKKKTTSSHNISLKSTDSDICDVNTTKTDLLKDQTVSSPENTQVQDHNLNTKYVSKPSHQLKNDKSDDNFTLEDTQKSCDDTQQEQVNSIIETQRITKKRTRWTPLPYETNSPQRKPFESRWLNRRHNYMSDKSKTELAGFDLHTPSLQHHRDSISLCQNSQHNTSLNLSGCGSSEKSSIIPELIHNQDNSQSMLHVEHNTSYSIFTNISSSQEHILQTSAFDAQKPSHSATDYNICKEKIINIPNFDPLQPPPNFNNPKGAVSLSPALDSHISSQEISNFKMHALDHSHLSAVSTSPTDLYCPTTFSTTQGTILLSTLSQSSVTSPSNLLSLVPNNASPILAYATSLQMTPCEISTTITNSADQVFNQHDIVKVNNELGEMQEAMQLAKQAMNVADINHIDESNQTLHSETHLLNISLEQKSVSDATSSAKLQKTPNKIKGNLNKYSNKPTNKKGQVMSESRLSSEFEHEKQLSQSYNVEENTLLINEQNPTKMMHNLNPILNKINKQEKLYQRTESSEREKCIPYKSQSNMNLRECSSEKKVTESPLLESSWKTRIINRFLKMSKNDIRNMINNCSLRKFDIAMKHLIKEKKSSLSLEMRNIQDEKIKGYDGEEFMNQLNAMLDPTAIVDITNLPTEFIRHLSEVLQLDAIELTENVSNQFNNGNQCNNADALTALHTNETEMLNNTVTGENVNVIKANDKANRENNNESTDYCNIITTPIIIESSNNDNNEVMFVTPEKTQTSKILDSNLISSKIRSETNDLNNTNTVTKNISQKNFEKGEQHSIFNMADLDEIAKTSIPIETTSTVSNISKNKTSSLIKHHGYNSEDEYISKSKRYNRWIRREREGPDAFRNLTKEEWEAKYGRQTKSSSNACRMQINRYYNSRHVNTRYNKTFNSRRHSPLSLKRSRNYKTNISKKMIKKDKNTKTVSSTSNTSESDDTSTSSDNRTPSEVTKLLKVIKEKEKIAKNKSLNEKIRDEVTAEIQRKWNEEGKKGKYYTKDERTKEKKSKYKKERKKRRRKLSDSSSSDYDKDDKSNLLAETEIKKETINKEESDTILEKSITCNIKTVNNECSDKQISTKSLTDKKISSETEEKCTIQENDKCKQTLTIVQPKTKAQLKLIPSTSKQIEETEFMKNTAKIVFNAKCRENKTNTLNITDKPKMIEKFHQEDANVSGIKVASECSDNRLVNIIETAHIVSNDNDNTKKNLINTSINKEEHSKNNAGNLTKDISPVSVEVQESTTKGFLVNKEVCKKIDIKAYKARALQKKLENEDKIKEEQSMLSNNTSKSIIEEKDTLNTVLKEKLATIEITKSSIDSNKFKNIKSEGKKELKLKNKQIKKKVEIKPEMKNITGMLSDNQEKINNTSDISKLVENKAENGLLDAHTNKDEELIQKYSIQNKEIGFNNVISSQNILKETEDVKDERILTDIHTIGSANVITDESKSMKELQIPNLTETLNDTKTENKTDKSLSKCVKDSKDTNLELNLIDIQDVSKTNTVECGHMSIHSTNSANANLLVSSNEQNIHVKENIVIIDKVNQKLFENLENLEILKVHSPESVGSPFKGFEATDDQHVETNNIITANEDNVEIDENKKLQISNNDVYNWQSISSQNISADNNNISFKNIFNDSLNKVKETCVDKEQIVCEKSSDINEGTIFNLNNNIKLLDNDNDKGNKETSIGQLSVQNDEISIPYTSSQQHKMPMLNEYEDNAVMEKSDIDILQDSSFKNQSFIKNIGSICASIEANPLNIHNTIPSSFSEISNETSKTTIDTDTELSLNSLVEDNATDHNSTFKDILSQNIVNVTNQNSYKEESVYNNDSFSNNSVKSFVSAEKPYKTSSLETLKKLQIPTKAALKESRNIFPIMDGSFSSIKGTAELKDPHSKLNICSDEAAVDFLSDQISQKENINNKVIDLEQKSSHSTYTSLPGDKDLDRSIHVESLSKTALNNVKIISDEILISSNYSNCSKELENNDTPNSAVNSNEIKEANKGIANTIHNSIEKNKTDEHLMKLSCTKTQQQERTNSLHKIKTNKAMKHQMKNTCKSNSVHITNKNIKEEIMARMIEIDVEIHKLMTEKMTLYQMLENDSLLLDKVPLNSNLGSEINREKIVPVGLETLSSSVSRIIQNTEISGEHSDCIVTSSRENALSETNQNQAESKVRDIYESKNESLLQEEDINTKQPLLTDSLENRTISEDNDSLQSLLLSKDEDNIQKDGTVSPENHLEENQDTYSTIEETLNNLTENNSLDSITDLEKDEQLDISSTLELTKPSNTNQDTKHTSDENKKQNVESVKTSKNNNSINASLIYSDDSTWSSFAQTFEEIERKKHNTGLALLEETYKREIAENRKLKASARKKKKKELNTFLKSVNYLTPEEEEIPLNTLYIKKLQQKRDLLNSLDDKIENYVMDGYPDAVESEEVWKHAIEVINAVAEDRIKDLYVEKAKESRSEICAMSSNTLEQNEGICTSEMLTNLNESLQNSNEPQNTTSLLSYNPERNSIKCSLAIIDKNIIFQSKEKEENNENKKNNVQSTVNSSDNLEVHSAVTNISSDNTLTQKEISLIEPLVNADCSTNMSTVSEANELNISNTKLNKNQNTHVSLTNLLNENTTMNTLTSENCKYNNKTEETNIQGICLLKNKEIDIPTIGFEKDVTISRIGEKIANTTNDLLKKCKDEVPITINPPEEDEISVIYQSSNIHNKKILKRKDSNKNISIRKRSKHAEDNIKDMECNNTNSKEEKDPPKICHDSKSIVVTHQDPESTSSNVKRNRNSQKLQTIKNKKHLNCLESKESIKDELSVENENLIKHNLPNVDLQISKPNVPDIGVKRKMHDQAELMNCKVVLIDVLKSNMYKHIKKNCHTSFTASHIPHKSNTLETTTNSAHRVTSSKIKSSMVEANKLKDVPKSKHSYISSNVQEQTSNTNQRHVTFMTSEDTKELKSHHKTQHDDILYSDEYLSLKSNYKDISIVPIKPVTSNVKIQPQDKNIELEIIEDTTKEQHIVHQSNDEKIPLPDAIIENEQPLKTHYTVHKGPILDIKVFRDTFLAASEDGSIYRYSQVSNEILNIYKGHRSAVTCLYIHKSSSTDHPKDLVYSGSLDGTLRCYNIKTGASINNIANIGSPIQCMDQAWGIIFIGTKSGHVSRFHIKFGVVKGDNIQFSNNSVLALKATNEGPRKVLIVASRNQPITIRDAQNGLFLRTICGQKNHTVYSLMLNNNLIYCGTSSTSILVFDFTNGEQKMQYNAGVGIVCMRLYHKLLFAGCYDGNIYVFDIQNHRLICSIPGPGNMLLSMEVVDNKIIAGSKDKRLHTWQMPKQVQVVSCEQT